VSTEWKDSKGAEWWKVKSYLNGYRLYLIRYKADGW
jgi:hypothetical protein